MRIMRAWPEAYGECQALAWPAVDQRTVDSGSTDYVLILMTRASVNGVYINALNSFNRFHSFIKQLMHFLTEYVDPGITGAYCVHGVQFHAVHAMLL